MTRPACGPDRVWQGALVVVAAVVAALTSALTELSADARLFVDAGIRLLSTDGLNVFDDPKLQTGPADLLLMGVLGLIGRATGIPLVLLVPAVCAALVALLLLALPAKSRAARTGLLGSCVLAGPFAAVTISGHYEELLVLVTLLLAAAAAQQDRPARAGVLLGVSAAFKLWGVLGLPVLLLLPVARRRVAVAWASVVLAASYGPFLVLGLVRTFDYEWRGNHPSPIALLVGSSSYGWPLRLGQGLLTVAVGLLVARRWTGSSARWAAVPLACVCARLLGDPNILSYYWAVPIAAALCLLWVLPGLTLERRLMGALAVAGVGGLAMLAPGRYGSGVATVVLVGTLGLLLGGTPERRTDGGR